MSLIPKFNREAVMAKAKGAMQKLNGYVAKAKGWSLGTSEAKRNNVIQLSRAEKKLQSSDLIRNGLDQAKIGLDRSNKAAGVKLRAQLEKIQDNLRNDRNYYTRAENRQEFANDIQLLRRVVNTTRRIVTERRNLQRIGTPNEVVIPQTPQSVVTNLQNVQPANTGANPELGGGDYNQTEADTNEGMMNITNVRRRGSGNNNVETNNTTPTERREVRSTLRPTG